MQTIHQGLPNAKFSDTKPSNVTTATICRSSGKLATEACRNDPRGNQVYTENFINGTAPTEKCTTHVMVDICADTGFIANEHCPNRVTTSFITRPSTEIGNWSRAADAKYMYPNGNCTIHAAPAQPVTPEQPENHENPQPPENNETPQTPEEPEEPEEPEQPGNTSGGNNTGGNSTGGDGTGGNNTGGNNTGGNSTGGNNTGGNNTGGNSTGGNNSSGNSAEGNNT